jgi:hypothetical protein
MVLVATKGSHRQFNLIKKAAGSPLPDIWQMIMHPVR